MATPVMTRGLSRADQDQIREALVAGRRPKVVFTDTAGQIAGQTGQVVELTDPAVSDEWITVRFGKDELPFSPVDLAMPAKVGGSTKTTPVRAVPARRAEPAAPAPQQTATAVAKETAGARAQNRGAAEANSAMPKAEPEFVLDRPPATSDEAQAAPEASGQAGFAASGPQPRPAKAAKPAKPPASLVVTLSYAEREWTIAATQGAKALAKPYVVSPADALRMVALIDVPSVHEAVESIIAAERAEAETRAVKLRAELAELEVRLAELAQHP
jgi:hypothetical protein